MLLVILCSAPYRVGEHAYEVRAQKSGEYSIQEL